MKDDAAQPMRSNKGETYVVGRSLSEPASASVPSANPDLWVSCLAFGPKMVKVPSDRRSGVINVTLWRGCTYPIMVSSGRSGGVTNMATNVEEFSVFAAAVIDRLYDTFPVLITLERQDFLCSENVNRWLADLDGNFTKIPEGSDSFTRFEARAAAVDEALDRYRDYDRRRDILRGTIDFLIAEGLVRCDEAFSDEIMYRRCQLTSRGFTHLHKEFRDKRVADGSSSVIRWIKERFTSTSSTEGAVIVALITKFIG